MNNETIRINKVKCPKCDSEVYRIMTAGKGINVDKMDSVMCDTRTKEMLTAHVTSTMLLPSKTLWYCKNCHNVCDTKQLTRYNLKCKNYLH